MIIEINDIGTHIELIDDADQTPREIGQIGGNRSDDFNKYTRALVPKTELLIIEHATHIYIETSSTKVFKITPSNLGGTNTGEIITKLKGMLSTNTVDKSINVLEKLKEELKGVNKKLNKVLC